MKDASHVDDAADGTTNPDLPARITFAPDTNQPHDRSKTLYIPPPIEREKGRPLVEKTRTDPDGMLRLRHGL
jgi:hypothetical protein